MGAVDPDSADRSPEDRQLKPGGIRVEGDDIVIPLVEEVLVKKPVVREVLRIRKRTVTERRTVGEDLRREDVEVERRDPDSPDSD